MGDSRLMRAFLIFNWVLLFGSLGGWCFSALTSDEPIWILSLSWAAITIGSMGTLVTAYVLKEQKSDD